MESRKQDIVIAAPEMPQVGISDVEQLLPAETEPSQEELFSAHVASVYEHGDAIDRLHHLRWRSTLLRAGTPAVVTAEAMTATAPTTGIAFGLAAGVISTSLTVGHSLYKNKKDRERAREQMAYETQDALGEAYELYRPKTRLGSEPKPVELVWYGPVSKDDAPDQGLSYRQHLVKMAKLAGGQGVERMYVDDHALYGLESQAAAAGRHMVTPVRGDTSPKQMIRATKSREAYVAGNSLASKTPEEWLAYAETLAPVVEDLDKYKTLAALVPEHPLSRIVTDFHEDPELMLKKLRERSARALDEHMVRHEARPNEAYRAAIKGTAPLSEADNAETLLQGSENTEDKKASQSPNHQLRKHVAYQEFGSVRGGRVVAWQTEYGKELQGIHAATGISEEMIPALLEDPDASPTKTNKAVEVAFYKLAHGENVQLPTVQLKDEKQEEDPSRAAVSLAMPVMAQDVLVAPNDKNGNFRKRKVHQVIGGATLAVSALMGGVLAHAAVDEFRDARVTAVRAEMAKERNLPLPFISKDNARKEVEHKYPDMWLWDKVTDTEKFLGDKLPRFPDKGNGLAGRPDHWTQENSDSSSPSNSGDDSDEPVFGVQSHGGMGVGGYWPSSTSNQLVFKRDQHDNIYPTWEAEQDVLHTTTQFPKSLPESYKNGQWLRVDHELAEYETTDYGQTGKYFKLNIPVREGTKPVAATMDGEGVQLVEKKDHTYELVTTDQDVRHVSYWLAPDGDSKPTFQGPIKLRDEKLPGKTADQWLKNNKDLLAKTLQKQGELNPSLRGQAAIDGAEAVISGTWKYDVNPLDDEKYHSMQGYKDFVDMTTEAKTADCEVANTLVAVSKYDKSNIVNGFYNVDAGNALSEKEGHEWRTDGDATPHSAGGLSLTVGETDANESGYGLAREVAIDAAVVGVGGISLALGMGAGSLTGLAWHRRRLFGRAKHSTSARAAADVALYAKSFTAEAYEHRKAELGDSHVLELMTTQRPDLHSKAAVKGVRAASKSSGVDKQLSAELKQASGLLKTVRGYNTAVDNVMRMRSNIRKWRGKRPTAK